MPPWKAAPTSASSSRTLARYRTKRSRPWSPGPRRALPREPGDLPPPPKFPDDWQLGTPDLVVDIGTDFAVPA